MASTLKIIQEGLHLLARGFSLDDCGTLGTAYKWTIVPTSGQNTIGDTSNFIIETNAIETTVFPYWHWNWSPDSVTRPIYIGFCLNLFGPRRYGWIRVVHYPRQVSTGLACLLPVAWALETTTNTALQTPCDADYNFDGVGDFFDYLEFVSDFAAGWASARFNGDQELDFFDYLDFLEAYSEGCL